jgi:hypothetical protein
LRPGNQGSIPRLYRGSAKAIVLLRKRGEDPLGDEPTEDLSKKTLDKLLAAGEPEAAGVVQGAMEDFAQEFARVIRRFLKLKAWRETERIVIGGGFRASRVGELVIDRADVMLKADGVENWPPSAMIRTPRV